MRPETFIAHEGRFQSKGIFAEVRLKRSIWWLLLGYRRVFLSAYVVRFSTRLPLSLPHMSTPPVTDLFERRRNQGGHQEDLEKSLLEKAQDNIQPHAIASTSIPKKTNSSNAGTDPRNPDRPKKRRLVFRRSGACVSSFVS